MSPFGQRVRVDNVRDLAQMRIKIGLCIDLDRARSSTSWRSSSPAIAAPIGCSDPLSAIRIVDMLLTSPLPQQRTLDMESSMPTLERPNCDIYYEETGSGPAIIFAHGAGGNHLSWWQQIPLFAKSYRCVAFESPRLGPQHSHRRSGAGRLRRRPARLDGRAAHRSRGSGRAIDGRLDLPRSRGPGPRACLGISHGRHDGWTD